LPEACRCRNRAGKRSIFTCFQAGLFAAKALALTRDKFPTQDKFIVTVSFYRYSLGSQHLADNI
jgi:hypothetical protein